MQCRTASDRIISGIHFIHDLKITMWRISSYKDRLLPLATIVGAIASVLGLIVPLFISSKSITWWMIVLVIAFFVMISVTVGVILRSSPRTKIYRGNDRIAIRNYMFQWIKNGGRVSIWTRDMSWVDDQEMKSMLRSKSESGELIICLPEETALTESLRGHGAEVIAYGALESPSSSFTIVNYDRHGSRVAVGRPEGSLHIIQEFSVSDSPTFQMAYDLVRLVRGQKNAGK